MTGPMPNRQGITHQQRRLLTMNESESETLSILARRALIAQANPTGSAEPIMKYVRYQLEKGLIDPVVYHAYIARHARSLTDRQCAYPSQVIEEDVV
jgi:hypothetical protein